jgi:uncharacterized membrane protein
MNPFDLKSALLAKHAQHVMMIHFPIALFIVSVLFDALAQWKKKAALAAAAYYNLTAAAVSVLPTLATGALAWQWQLEGKAIRGALRLHIILAVLSSVLIWLIWWFQFRGRRSQQPTGTRLRLSFEFATVALITLTAHLGGFLSGVNSPG